MITMMVFDCNGERFIGSCSFQDIKKQKQIISGRMYEAYRKQAEEDLSDEEALQLVFSCIEGGQIT